ncbi:hypothetical protein YC2023_029717 [Brassica napus]
MESAFSIETPEHRRASIENRIEISSELRPTITIMNPSHSSITPETPDSSAKGARTTRNKAGYTPSRGPPCTRVDIHCSEGNHRASRSLKSSQRERRERLPFPFFFTCYLCAPYASF